MKNILILALLLGMACTGCKSVNKAPSGGIYELEKQTVHNGKRDFIFPVRQYKIYTDKYYIYVETGPRSLMLFDVGSYRPDSTNTIITHNIFGSRLLDSAQEFRLWLNRKDSNYTEFNPKSSYRRGVTYQLTDVYRPLPAGSGSKLDGLWYVYNQQFPQSVSYEAFYKGYFIAVRHNAIADAFFYGRFQLKNDSLIEQVLVASNPELVNENRVYKLTFTRKGEFMVKMQDTAEHYVQAQE